MATAKKSITKKSTTSPREAALAAATALPASEVQRQPAYLKARVSWLRTLIPLITKDRGGLLDAPLDPPLAQAELDMFPALVELVGEADAGAVAHQGATKLTAAESQRLAALRAHQTRLDRAFRVRLRADKQGLRALAEIRRGEPGDPEDVLQDARKLVALADDARHKAWVGALKKGEPEAVTALRAAIPELESLSTRVASAGDGRAVRDRLRRLSTLALRVADRVVTAGQYHTSDVAGRERDYARFQRPTARKPRKKTG